MTSTKEMETQVKLLEMAFSGVRRWREPLPNNNLDMKLKCSVCNGEWGRSSDTKYITSYMKIEDYWRGDGPSYKKKNIICTKCGYKIERYRATKRKELEQKITDTYALLNNDLPYTEEKIKAALRREGIDVVSEKIIAIKGVALNMSRTMRLVRKIDHTKFLLNSLR